MLALSQRIGRARRQCGQLDQRLGGLRRVSHEAPADAREPAQVGDDRSAPFGQQFVEGQARVGFWQEGFDGVAALQGSWRSVDPPGTGPQSRPMAALPAVPAFT